MAQIIMCHDCVQNALDRAEAEVQALDLNSDEDYYRVFKVRSENLIKEIEPAEQLFQMTTNSAFTANIPILVCFEHLFKEITEG